MAVSRARTRESGPNLPLWTGKVVKREQIPAPKEYALQIQVVTVLKQHLAEGWEFTHPASGELRDKRTAAKLKAMGVMPDWPDLLLVSPDALFHGLELKRRGGRLSDGQEAFHARARTRGWNIAVADTFDAALSILQSWGCLRIKIAEGR